ncbi:hypothetical protein BH20ACT2_BH20ACT2_22160 [soil metagenome]
MTGVGAWLVAAAAGLVVARALVWAAADVLANPVLQRRNHRDLLVPTAGGLLVAAAILPLEAVRSLLGGFGVIDEGGEAVVRASLLFACFGFAFLGLVDDLLGTDGERGFRGHLRAVAHGRMTTGALKLFGGGALALVLAAPASDSGARLVGDALLIALAANLANLLDRAPGRAVKAALVAYVPVAVVAGAGPVGLGLASVMGATVGVLPDDLRERLMLGDTGANLLGAVLGLAVVLEATPAARSAVLAGLVVLNLASEVVSFSKVIDRVAPLRFVDQLGRKPPGRSSMA